MSCKRLHIFRVGKHTASNGQTFEFTESMLRDAVNAYDPALHEAPIVVGHPKTDDPAFGWVKSLHFTDGNVEADEQQVAPEFSELREAGRFKKISAAWYMPDAPANPKPGVMYLKHVGFLGAAAPAIKGLRTATFAATDDGVIEFSDWADSQNAGLWRRMREFLIEKFGREDADKHLPDWEVKSLEEAARTETKTISNYSENQGTDVLTAEQIAAKTQELLQRETKLAADESAYASRVASFSEQERTQQRVAIVAFADTLIADGKLLPVHKDGVVAFMAQLDATLVVEFGEGDAKKSLPSLQWFKDFLTAQPKVVTFGEIARDTDTSAPVDLESGEAIAKAAREFQESERLAGRHIDVVAAVTHITKQQRAE